MKSGKFKSTQGPLLALFLLVWSFLVHAQEVKERNWSLNGYVKDMVTVISLSDSILVDNLIHNRLNFRWYPSDKLTLFVEMRNRVFSGDLVKAIPNYGEFIDTNNDFLDMSVLWVNNDNLVIHSVFDRAYVQWTSADWEIRFGRQRINWGTNVAWNPNDLFNAYSFFDFDYEERPGSDALRITKYMGFASSLELAAKFTDDIDKAVAALMYKVNKWNYDFQFIGGIMQGDVALGSGWAGNLGNASFKGELTWFSPFNNRPDAGDAFASSFSIDYSFKNSLYLLGSYLFNSEGYIKMPRGQSILLSSETLSARNLMPFKQSALIQLSFPLHPLINTGAALMAFPGDNSIFINPTLTFSLAESLDLGLFGQLFYGEKPGGKYGAVTKAAFARVKWSF
ncbi:MAG: hypothetical protein OEX02_20505 [Cyclobacteriaceae bacterium]|nr:hypothetical protein [Cyclobacteriaceae bacterium]